MKMTFLDYLKIYVRHPRLIIEDIRNSIENSKMKRLFNGKLKAYDYEEKNYYDVIVKSNYEQYVPENKYKHSIYNPMIVVWHELERMFDNGTGVATIRRMGIMGVNVDTQNENLITVTISLKRPGLLIGKRGSNINELESRLTYLFNRETNVKIDGIKRDINEPIYVGY